MDETAKIHPLIIDQAYMTFLFPWSFLEKKRKHITEHLLKNDFTFFTLDQKDLQDAFYGNNIQVKHEELDQYFLPYIERKLFPHRTTQNGFLRFSKRVNEKFTLLVHDSKFPFIVNSIDVILCPFGIGFITIRTEMDKSNEQLSGLLDFMNHFRVLEPKLDEEKGATIQQKEQVFQTTNEFVFDYLCPEIKSFIIHDEKRSGYFGSLPFFEDERMLSSGFLIANGEHPISVDHLYRMGQLNGKNPDGQSFMSSTNLEYMERYVQKHVHDRWAPDSYTVTSEHTQITVSLNSPEQLITPISQFMGTHHYNLMLHYFYKIMLFRLSFEYSEIQWEQDEDYVEELIELISKFSSRYYFGEVSARTEGKELSHNYREIFQLDNLYEEVKQTLNELYRAQENQANKRHNMLLFMLTVFTVISGIYGMNLVIEDWKGKTDWSKVPGYSFFEWISLITAVVGISLSIILMASTGGKGIWKKIRKWKRDQYK
ncbi:hypothetical protein [Paenisporosarcina indica]|uniref:hypothetical protein n=1 Tax=Paenisporosarcina indica TaxID=650093 RepID=UPI00094FC8E1|nr:hypothetical protein [Paenisporosarcina indica]